MHDAVGVNIECDFDLRNATRCGWQINKLKLAESLVVTCHAEKAKIELSQVQQTQINLPFITATPNGPLHLDVSLSRSKFQEMTNDLLERCRKPFEQAITDAGITKSQIKHVILVGGSTRMPAVLDLIQSLTGKEPNRSVNPDEVVAAGAAI
ncbi:MAG: hypothetical protein EB050_06155, partial [Actinobacteria bacterium]|nr:hypothetical protein [Actinomycetota bacterium]